MSGPVSGTWTVAGSPYIVTFSDITINSGTTLEIEPGVVVELQQGADIDVLGTLTANGVTFTWADGQNQWLGIRFYDSDSSGSSLQNCTIEHAAGYSSGSGIIYTVSSSPTLTGNTISNSTASRGIYISSSSPSITGNTISGMSAYGLYVIGDSSPTVTGNTITANNYGASIFYEFVICNDPCIQRQHLC